MNGKGDQLSGRLLDFVVKVIKIVEALPKTVAGRHIGGQLMRAGTSCGANYEEGCGAESRSDFVHKMSIVLKELKETRFWLRVIHRTEMLDSKFSEPVLDECEQLCAILGKSIITAKRNKKSLQNIFDN
ncbi:MAG: four helix bundle protein [Deltaproteobacteria bacterium]|nr:four helix bundle protein [Deltaproteobacteria bacterium]